MNITAYVVAYNNDENLVNWTNSLYKSTDCIISFKVINQGSWELSQQLTDFLFSKGCRQIINKLNHKSLADTWNFCINDCKTSFILLSNDDVTFKAGWIGKIEKHKGILYFGQSYCNVTSKKLYEEVGLYDEKFTSFGWEDADFYLRMLEQKIPMVYGSSGEYQFNGDDILQYFTHKDGTRCDFSKNNPNYTYFIEKYKKEFEELKSEYEKIYFEGE